MDSEQVANEWQQVIHRIAPHVVEKTILEDTRHTNWVQKVRSDLSCRVLGTVVRVHEDGHADVRILLVKKDSNGERVIGYAEMKWNYHRRIVVKPSEWMIPGIGSFNYDDYEFHWEDTETTTDLLSRYWRKETLMEYGLDDEPIVEGESNSDSEGNTSDSTRDSN